MSCGCCTLPLVGLAVALCLCSCLQLSEANLSQLFKITLIETLGVPQQIIMLSEGRWIEVSITLSQE